MKTFLIPRMPFTDIFFRIFACMLAVNMWSLSFLSSSGSKNRSSVLTSCTSLRSRSLRATRGAHSPLLVGLDPKKIWVKEVVFSNVECSMALCTSWETLFSTPRSRLRSAQSKVLDPCLLTPPNAVARLPLHCLLRCLQVSRCSMATRHNSSNATRSNPDVVLLLANREF